MPQFTKGSSGNPLGRPLGSRNRTGLALRLDKMVTAAAEGIVAGLVERAQAGARCFRGRRAPGAPLGRPRGPLMTDPSAATACS
jgi:hypothetical protein